MRIPYRSGTSVSISGSVITLAALLGVLWLAGGASRPDALGQVLVRTAAWLVLTGALLMMKRPSIHDVRPVAALLLAVLGLVLLQLVPLPPGVWQSLPGRAIFERAAVLAGESQPWRPLAIVPEAAYNAAASLVVPFAILVLIIGLDEREVTWLPGMLLTFIAVATLPGLAQFAGAAFNNPLINDTPGQVSGIFANRNHYALLLALGCLVAPVWAFGNGSGAIWRRAGPHSGVHADHPCHWFARRPAPWRLSIGHRFWPDMATDSPDAASGAEMALPNFNRWRRDRHSYCCAAKHCS